MIRRPLSDIIVFESTLSAELLKIGKLDSASLLRLQTIQQETGERLNSLVSKLGLVAERDLAEVRIVQL
ncbi:hypothetical protein [Kiloniella laminariae]|uniref:hypothetical protein n=1 Tax=Kiloniella laminariae TaxID=454162 RepID=UPI00037EA73D|nr:hypothetical protein [Kiloniella laminariae]